MWSALHLCWVKKRLEGSSEVSRSSYASQTFMSKERVRRENGPKHYGKTVTINRNRETEGREMIWKEKTKLDL